MFASIIDVYQDNDLDFDEAWSQGVRAILHETSRGTCETDGRYKDRKKVALEKGFLWAGFHLLSAEDPDKQLDAFFSMEDGSDPRVAMAIDWESSQAGSMTRAQLCQIVKRFNARGDDRYVITFSSQ